MYVIIFCWLFYTLSAPWYVWLLLIADLGMKWYMFRERDKQKHKGNGADIFPQEDGTFLAVFGDEKEIFDDMDSAAAWAMGRAFSHINEKNEED